MAAMASIKHKPANNCQFYNFILKGVDILDLIFLFQWIIEDGLRAINSNLPPGAGEEYESLLSTKVIACSFAQCQPAQVFWPTGRVC